MTDIEVVREWKEVKVPVPWGEIAVRECGDPEGEPWILLHGWLDNSGSFEPIAEFIAKGRRLLAVDYPGHGLSSHYPSGMEYDIMQFLFAVKRVVDHLVIEKVSLLGHSMGGMVSMIFASIYPEMTEKLVMLDIVSPLPKKLEGLPQRVRKHVEDFLKNEELSVVKKPKIYSYNDAIKRMVEANTQMFGKDNMNDDAIQSLVPRALKKIGDDKYIFTRDMRLYHLSNWEHYTIDLINCYAKEISCNHLIILCKAGFVNKERREAVEPVLHQYQKNPKFKLLQIEATHHAHMTDPKMMADVLNDF